MGTADLVNHELLSTVDFDEIRYEERAVFDRAGNEVQDLHQVWISLDNESQLNSYTTAAVKQLILAFRRASADRNAVAVVFTAVGSRSFCTGGNTAEYADYYAGRPLEYAQYMRLFNDMVTSILLCDKPVICRANGMRIGGGQEIGMACDFTVAGDHVRFGQAGPVHGSAPDGGSTDFLHLFVGVSKAAESLVICEPWSAHKALRLGLINEIVPVHKGEDGAFIPNPFAVTDQYIDGSGNIVYGDWCEGEAKAKGKEAAKSCEVDLSLLDAAVEKMVTTLMYTFPDCTRKTLESFRKKKLAHWYQNSETSRSWLSLNMNTEAYAGFSAFHFSTDKRDRQIDFIELRRQLSKGVRFDLDLIKKVLPESALAGFEKNLEER
ncbi:MAG: 6-oxocyclohex-1-ene-1-carbonyl-CoA hydratase [Deltaproteobacteria bacterium]|nr:6-oxocyclohex-1-ene-1-carbonyl-CoA hydratase [Deltaproteobacteria bacterium]